MRGVEVSLNGGEVKENENREDEQDQSFCYSNFNGLLRNVVLPTSREYKASKEYNKTTLK